MRSWSFEAYLRTGRHRFRVPSTVETKFNPWHDPKDGRFTFAPAGAPPANWRSGGRMSQQQVERRATNAMRMYKIHVARGMTPEEAAAWAANAEGESGGDFRKVQAENGPGRGLFQWGSDNPKFDRRRDFQRIFGHPIEQSTEEEQLAFRDWELANTEAPAAKRIAQAKGAGAKAAAIAVHYERHRDARRDSADRANIAEAILDLAKEGK